MIRQEEKAILLGLSNEIASARSKSDLLKVLEVKLRELFSISTFGITLINEEDQTHSAFVVDPEERIKKDVDFQRMVTQKYSLPDVVISKIISADEPVVFDVEELAAVPDRPEYVSFWIKMKVQKILGVSLRVGKKDLGCLLFHLDMHSVSAIRNDLVQSVSAQIAVAISNIVANEELTKREEEKTILLSLSTDIASLRSRSDFFRLVSAKVKELFSITEYGIAHINEDSQTYSAFLLDLTDSTQSHTDYKRVTNAAYSINDPVFSVVMNSDDPIIFKVDEIAKEPNIPEYVFFWKKIGLPEVLCVALRVGGKNIGCVYLHVDRSKIPELKINLLKGVCAELSVAISNILANEEIAKREEEKTILLSLSAEIAALRSRNDLFQVVNTKIKKVFSIQQFGIAQVNDDRITHSAFMMDLGDPIKNHNDFDEVTSLKYSIEDRAFSSIAASEDPVILDVNALAEDPDAPPYVNFWKAVGFRQLLCLALRAGGKIVGCIFFNIPSDEINRLKTNLLKSVCAQLAVSVSNILALEKIEKRERETETLLLVNTDISAARNNGELLQVINLHPKNLLSFSHTAIGIIDDDSTTIRAFLLDPESKSKDHPEYANATRQNYSLDNELINKILTSAGPVVYDLKQLQANRELPLSLKMSFESGIQQVIAMRFCKGDFVFGLWMMFFDVPIALDAGRYRLVQELSNQLSIAVSNIMANLEIEKREEEKSKLLAFSNALASVQDKNLLAKILKKQLQELFVIQDYAIHALSKDKKTHRLTLFDPDAPFAKHPDFSKLVEMDTDVNDGVFNKILAAEDPITFNVEEWYNSSSPPTYSAAAKSINLKKMTGMPLRLGQENIGVINFIQDEFNQVAIQKSLFKSICSQLAVRLSNIIDREEIQRREVEKSMLLEFSNAITSVRDRTPLAIILKKQLNQLFSIPDYVIHSLSEDKKTQRLIMFSPDATFANHPDFTKMVDADTDINDGVFNRILAADGPVIINAEEWYTTSNRPTYSKAAESINLKKIAGICLRFGEKSIGFLNFMVDEVSHAAIQKPLFKSICSQLATVLSNILANEDIEQREKEKARLLEFSNAIASVRDKFLLAKILKQQLFDLFSIKDYLINVLLDDKKCFIPLLYDQDADFIKDPTFQKTLLNPTDINDGIFDVILRNEDPVTFNVDEWSKWENPPSYLDTAVSIGLRKMTGVRIRLGHDDIAILNFRHDSFDLTPAQHKLLKSICSQIAIAVSNIIANEEIEGREREKARLLEFSNTLASARDKFSLSKILKAQLQDLFSIDDFSVNVLVDNKQKFLPYLYDQDADFIKDPAFQKILNTPTDIHDGIFDKTLSSEDPVTYNVEEWSTWEKPPPYLETAVAIGLKRMTGVRIRLGQDDIAVLNCRHDDFELVPGQLRLLKGISSQIAIAVSNIMANEKVNDQLDQINRYKLQLEEEKIYLKEEIETTHNYSEIIGESPTMKKVFRLVAQVAPSDSTVLILGETGTGKELIARAIHNSSPRKNKLMVKVNCAAFPVNLIESELFGHERGSFTGATERRIGKFELANHGTLFLDEIGEMPLELQVKLLRALQEKEIERVGGRTTIKVDVRIIAATNRDLEKLMADGRFRNDLYYRLNIFPISLPPLRNRTEDIPVLASHFIVRFAKKAGKKIKGLTNKALQQLIEYQWPGNIRELEHLIERSVLVTEGESIKEIHLPAQKQNKSSVVDPEDDITIKTIDDNERSHILTVLKHCKGRVSGEGGAAELLGVPSSTLNSKMKRLGIRKEHFG